MNCVRCGAELDPKTLLCPECGARHIRVCNHCGRAQDPAAERCGTCGGETAAALDMTREEMTAAGLKCFMPYVKDHNFDIYLGGNLDGGGYVFHNLAGYTAPPAERVVLPGSVEGYPIFGIWNEFFAVGDEFAPELQQATYARMMPIREIVVSPGIREAFTYAFFGCAGLEVLELPKSLISMKNDFYDLFIDGKEAMGNGVVKAPITIRYHGTAEDWERVGVTSRFQDYVRMGCIRMEYLGD